MRINGRNHLAWAMSAALSFSLLAATVGIADDKSKDRDRRRFRQDGIADQACHHSDRRESRHGSYLRRLQAEGQAPDHFESAFQGHRQRGRLAGRELLPGPAVLGASRSRCSTLALPTRPRSPTATAARCRSRIPPARLRRRVRQARRFRRPFLAGVAAIDPSPDFTANTDTILTTGFTEPCVRQLSTPAFPTPASCRTDRSFCRDRTSATTTTPATRRIGSTRRGSSRIAASRTPPRRIPADASMICFPS